MKLNAFSIFLLGLSSSVYADDWSSDDWGQWVNEEMTSQEFSDDNFDRLNQFDGISQPPTSKKNRQQRYLTQ